MSTTLQPTLQSSRNYFLDVWRGFAITGVLFAYIIWNLGWVPKEQWTNVDKIIAEFTGIMIDGKFYTTLSILFGIGFFLQTEKSRQNQQSVTPFALRRILLLLLIGAAHAIFLRQGDILMPYAVCSLYLFFVRNASNKSLLGLMSSCFLFPALYYEFIKWTGYKASDWHVEGSLYFFNMLNEFLRSHNPVYFLVSCLGYFLLFILGFYAAKNNWLYKLSLQPKNLIVVLVTGIVIGVGFSFVVRYGNSWLTKEFGQFPDMNFYQRLVVRYAGSFFWLLHTISLAVSYMAGLYWLYLRNYKMKAFANMGRMALTNYLTQSMIMFPACFIFGLFGHFNPLKAFAWSAGIWIVQAIFSTWWLKRYNFGPFEWLLRSFTYWKWQPIKKKEKTSPNTIAA